MHTNRWTSFKRAYFLTIFSLSLFFTLLACGSPDGEKIPEQIAASPKVQVEEESASSTPYGTKPEIETYLNRINPHVQEVGRIQLSVDKNIGTSGRATGSNLAPIMDDLKPNLEDILDTLSVLNPPPLLSSFHGNFKKLVTLRIAAYDTVIRGYKTEKETGDLSVYEQAEAQLDEANEIIVLLNGEMGKIMKSLESSSNKQTASPQ